MNARYASCERTLGKTGAVNMEENEIQQSPFEDGAQEELENDVEEGVEEEDDIEEELDDDDSDELGDDTDEDLDDGDDLSDEDLDDIIDEVIGDEQEIQTVPHAALHQERMKRKELQNSINEFHANEAQMQDTIQGYEQTIADIQEKLKEYGLEDEIKLDSPKNVDPEVLEMRQQKQHHAMEAQMTDTIDSLQGEAADYIMDYPALNGEDPAQSELIIGLALSAHILGADREDSIQHALQLVNNIVVQKTKEVRRSSRPRKKAVGTRARVSKSPKNTREFFDNMAESIGE